MKPLAAELKQEFDIYRPLSSLDLYLSNWGLFGIFNPRRKLLVDDRAFKCWFLLKSQKPQYLNIKIATDSRDMIREAMHARVKYFNWRMKEITGAHSFTRGRRGSRKRLSYFFADPLEKVERQRLWLKPPEGAKFVVLTFERGDYTSRLGFSSKIKLKAFDEKAGAKDLQVAYRDIMKSRDRMRMTWFIERLKNEARTVYHPAPDIGPENKADRVQSANHEAGIVTPDPAKAIDKAFDKVCDKGSEITGDEGGQNHLANMADPVIDPLTPVQMARSMLAHMVYLWQGVEEKRALMVIDDAAHLARNGFTLSRQQHSRPSPQHGRAGSSRATENHFEYDMILISEWERSGLMSSQMRLEAMHLMQAVKDKGAGAITLREGRQYLARLMVAVAVVRQTGWNLKLDVSETLWSKQTFGEWCRWHSLLDWLVFSGVLGADENIELIARDDDQLNAVRAAGIGQYVSVI